jgi:hypothetical protein
MYRLLRFRVLVAVNFNNQSYGKTDEIRKIGA